MKYLQTFSVFESQISGTLTPKQEAFLDRYTRGTWSVNPATGLVDVQGSFYCPNQGLKSLGGIRFGTVEGSFWCNDNQLITLEGAPQTVEGNFWGDAFELEPGKWNPTGWLEILRTGSPEAQKLILTLPYLDADWWNSELSKDPARTIQLLAPWWSQMSDDLKRGIRIPHGYEDRLGMRSEFSELGLF
jgi:hypothetical protein